MPEIKFNIGAMVDVASSAEMGDHFKHLQGHMDKAMHRRTCQPIRRYVRTASTAAIAFGTQTATQIISGITPALGKVWVVRSIAVYDAGSPLTAENASAVGAVCVGDSATPVPSHITAFTFTGTPASDTFNTSSIVVKPNENIYVVIAGTITENLAFNCEVDEWDDVDFQAQSL